jgi:type III secretion protein D
MYELRILSGLHRGATLPLDERSHVIGASDDADVVIVDPEIEGRHASLSLTSSGWKLAGMDGSVRNAQSNQAQAAIDLAPGEFARVGNVWITVVEQNARWSNPPPEPAEELFDASAPEDEPVPLQQSAAGLQSPVTKSSDEHPGGSGANLKKRSSMVLVSLGLIVVASAAGAYALRSSNSPIRTSTQLSTMRTALTSRISTRPADPTIAKAFDKLNEGGTAQRQLTPEELRKAFRKRLADADLLKRFDLMLQDEQWTLQASLDDEETARFEHILASFIKTHGITFPVRALVGSGEAMLPFKIRQVVSGRDASVVTQSGERLYIGDELHGVRLVAIRGSRLTFAGKRKIEVIW